MCLRRLVKSLIEDTLEEEMLVYQRRERYQKTQDRLDYRKIPEYKMSDITREIFWNKQKKLWLELKAELA